MTLATCLWCETEINSNVGACPECGLQNPAGRVYGRSAAALRPRRRLTLALFALPLMAMAAYAAHLGAIPLMPAAAPAAAKVQLASTAPLPVPSFSSPLQKAVWTDGMKAVRQALRQSGDAAIRGSFVDVAGGSIVSLCGQVAGTSGYNSATGEQRFVSVFGQPAATTVEGTDPSFGVLWNRVCSQGQSPD